MKPRFWIFIGACALALGRLTAPAWGVTPVPPITPKPPVDLVASDIQAIQTAADPSAAVAAYARGLAIDPRSPALHDAYVRRMVSFHVPHLAGSQAQLLTQLQPDNGLAWAVVAFTNAQKGQMDTAFAEALLAGARAPTDAFVAATAAQLVAWYDQKPDRPEITPGISSSAAKLRQLFADNQAYAATYKDALADLKDQDAGQNSAATPTALEAPQPLAPEGAPIYSESVTNTYYPPDYTNYGYQPDYYTPYYGSTIWPSPFFFSSSFFLSPHRHHHHRIHNDCYFFDRPSFHRDRYFRQDRILDRGGNTSLRSSNFGRSGGNDRLFRSTPGRGSGSDRILRHSPLRGSGSERVIRSSPVRDTGSERIIRSSPVRSSGSNQSPTSVRSGSSVRGGGGDSFIRSGSSGGGGSRAFVGSGSGRSGGDGGSAIRSGGGSRGGGGGSAFRSGGDSRGSDARGGRSSRGGGDGSRGGGKRR